MTDPHRADPHPALWQPHELLAGHSTTPASTPTPTPPEPDTATNSATDSTSDTGADAEGGIPAGAGPIGTQLVPRSLPSGSGRVALPVAVLSPRELEPYVAHHRYGSDHRGYAVISVDHQGQPARSASGGWDYTAPGLRGGCRCGWAGPLHPQTPIPAQHDRSAMRDPAWREVNRAARRAIDLDWLGHIHTAVPSLGITVVCLQREILDRALDDAVEHARLHGAPWQEIGDEARMTRQSAHERWRHLDPPRAAEVESPPTEGPSTPPARPSRRVRRDDGADRG